MSFIDDFFTKRLKPQLSKEIRPKIEKQVEQKLEKKFSKSLDKFVRNLDPFLNRKDAVLPGNWKVVNPGDLGLGAKSSEYLKQYMEWVYANASAISEAVSAIEFQLFKYIDSGDEGEDVEEIHEHELLEILYKVNNYTTKTDFIYAMQLYLTLTGEAPIRLRMTGKTIDELWLLNPAYFKVFVGKDNEGFEMITGYKYSDPRTPGKDIDLKPWEVIFIKTPNPENQWRGIGVIEAAARTIDILNYSEQYNLQFFKNSAIPYIALHTDQKLSDATFERLKENFKAEHQGVDNAYKTAILESGLKIERLQTSAKDMDFLEQQRFMRDKLMAMFKTTKVVLGITEDVNRANAEASEYVFMKHCVRPKMRRICDQLNEFFVPLFDTSKKLFLDFEDPITQDMTEKSKEYALAVDKWMTKNEIRRELDLPDIDGGDEIWQPLMLAPMGEKPEPIIQEKPVEEKPTEEEIQNPDEEKPKEELPKTEEGKVINYRVLKVKNDPKKRLLKKYKEQIARLKNRNVTIKQLTKKLETQINKVAKSYAIKKRVVIEKKYKDYKTFDTQEFFWKNQIKMSEPYENKIKSEIRLKIYNEQKIDILNKLRKAGKGLKFIIRKPRKVVVKSASDYMYDKDLYVKAGIDLLTPIMKELIEQHGEEALELLGSDVSYELLSEARKYLTSEPLKASKSLNKTIYGKVRKSLADGLENGEGIPKLAKRIDKVYSGLEAYQLNAIARTETSRAVNFATVDGYRQSGVVNGKEWLTAFDERTCDWCEEMNGKVIALDEDYFKEGDTMKVGKESLDISYEDVGEPPLHVSCRCTTIPVIGKSFKPKIKRTKKVNPKEKANKLLEQIEKEINGPETGQGKAQKV